MYKAELYNDCRNILGEGITWSKDQENLYWVDIAIPSKLLKLDLTADRLSIFNMPEKITSLSIIDNENLIVASKSGINNFNLITKKLSNLLKVEPSLGNRSNDGAADAKGRFWFGTMQDNFDKYGNDIPVTKRNGNLYRLDKNLKLNIIESKLGIPNTFVWSPDNTKFYFADTLDGIIFRYDFDLNLGLISNKTFFAKFHRGFPDGSAIDSKGYLWNARWGGSCVVRFDPDGKIDRVIEVPVKNVTNCIFGGKNLNILFITTARQGLSEQYLKNNPIAGGLFAIELDVNGIEDNKSRI